MSKTEITIKVSDIRPYNKTGKYHNENITFSRYSNALYVKYGTHHRWQNAEGNNDQQEGRISIWGKQHGKPDDIRMGIQKFVWALNQIGLDLDADKFAIVPLKKDNNVKEKK